MHFTVDTIMWHCPFNCTGTCVSLWTGPAPEAWLEVVARGGHVTGVSQVTLVQVRARGSVSGQTLGTGPTSAQQRKIYC